MTGIYKITEISTGLCYIGQSKTIEKRWLDHHKRFPLHRFKYEVMIQCPVEDLNRFEIDFISRWDSHRNGFNGTIGGSAWGPRSDAAREKIRAARLVAPPRSSESCEKMRLAKLGNTNGAGNKGKTHSPEARAKLKAAATAQWERARQAKLEVNLGV